MSDYKSFSAAHLLQAQASSSGSGHNLSGVTGAGKFSDDSFSRELSRASGERAKPSTDSYDTRTKGKVDQATHRSDKDSESAQRADAAGVSEKEVAAKSDKSHDTARNASETNEKPSSAKVDNNKDTGKQPVLSGGDGTQQSKNPVANSSTSNTAVEQDSDSALPDAKSVESLGIGHSDIDAALAEATLGVGEHRNPLPGAGGLEDLNAVLGEQNVDSVTNNVLTSSKPGEVGIGQPSSKSLSAGEQLSLSQLVNRRAPHLNAVAGSDTTSATALQQAVADNTSQAQSGTVSAREAAMTTIASGALAEATKGKDTKAGTIGARVSPDGLVSSASTQIVMGAVDSNKTEVDDISLKLVAATNVVAKQDALNRAQTADIEAEINMTELMAAQKALKQNAQENQTLARQLALQQVQNMNPTPLATTGDSIDKANLSADNTFHSLPVGIVTAPVVQRADAGNSQTINAPINLQILQNDADKALAGNIRWMASEGVKSAVVNVTPSGMGPISVSIGIEKDQMNVSIVALQGSTREALDSMLPRLKEQLGAQGQDSVRVDISDGSSDKTDRGYGQHLADDQNDASQTERFMGDHGMNESGMEPSNDEMLSTVSQATITVNGQTQLISRYDLYV